MKAIHFLHPDGSIHKMPRGISLADAKQQLLNKGIQLTGLLVDGLWQARSVH